MRVHMFDLPTFNCVPGCKSSGFCSVWGNSSSSFCLVEAGSTRLMANTADSTSTVPTRATVKVSAATTSLFSLLVAVTVSLHNDVASALIG